MIYLLKRSKEQTLALGCKETSPKELKSLTSPLAQRILKRISEKDSYPKELSKYLGVHEQKVYYHIKNLEKSEILKRAKAENIQGVTANYYTLSSPSFAVTFKEFKPYKICLTPEKNKFLSPFIQDGELNSLIITGSPITHGKHQARSRDLRPTTELILFLGTYISRVTNQKSIKLDTEIKQSDLKNNLILVGGPIANSITAKINKHLPIKFSQGKILSSCSKKRYSHDETGMITKIQNPFDKTKSILVLAGNTHLGTKACITALFKKLEEISYGNRYKPRIIAKVVEGIDMDSDNEVEDVTILE